MNMLQCQNSLRIFQQQLSICFVAAIIKWLHAKYVSDLRTREAGRLKPQRKSVGEICARTGGVGCERITIPSIHTQCGVLCTSPPKTINTAGNFFPHLAQISGIKVIGN